MKTVKKLQTRLQKESHPQVRKWFENYLRDVISYRGVKTPKVTEIMDQWRLDEGLDQWPLNKQFQVVCTLIRQKKAEDKFAGIIYIQKHLLKKMDSKTLLEHFNRLYSENCFYDWSTTDWFCVRVLDPMIVSGGTFEAKTIADWKKSQNLWQRRSSIVSFRNVSKNKKYHSMIKQTIAHLVKEQERFIQTGIGWVLSDMSKQHPKVAAQIVKKHFHQLSMEVIRRHTKHLPDHRLYKEQKSSD